MWLPKIELIFQFRWNPTWISETSDREPFMLDDQKVPRLVKQFENSRTRVEGESRRSEVAGISRLRLSFFLPTNNGRELLVIQHKL